MTCRHEAGAGRPCTHTHVRTPTHPLNEAMRSPPRKWGGRAGSWRPPPRLRSPTPGRGSNLLLRQAQDFPHAVSSLGPGQAWRRRVRSPVLVTRTSPPHLCLGETVHIPTRGRRLHLPESLTLRRPHTALPGWVLLLVLLVHRGLRDRAEERTLVKPGAHELQLHGPALGKELSRPYWCKDRNEPSPKWLFWSLLIVSYYLCF